MDLSVAVTSALDAHSVAAFCVALMCKRCANSHCERAACRTHCRLSGGCAIKNHVLPTGGQLVEDDPPSVGATSTAATHPPEGLALQNDPSCSFSAQPGPPLQPIVVAGSSCIHRDTDPSCQSVIRLTSDNHSFARSPSPVPGPSFVAESDPPLQPIIVVGSPHAHGNTNAGSHQSVIRLTHDSHSFARSPSPVPDPSFVAESDPPLQSIIVAGSPHVHGNTNAGSHQSVIRLTRDSHSFARSPSPVPGPSFVAESDPPLQPNIVATLDSPHVHGDIKPPLPVNQDSEQLSINVKNTVTVYVWKEVSAGAFCRSHCLLIKFIGGFPTCSLSVPEQISIPLFLLHTLHSPSSWPFRSRCPALLSLP